VQSIRQMHYIQFNQIVRDAEIANVISSVVREHRLTEGEIEKALLEPRIPRAANAESGFSRIDAEHAIANGA